jgi:alpha-L-fucosidase
MRRELLQAKMKRFIAPLLISSMLGMISISCKFKSDEKVMATVTGTESEQHMEWFKEAKFGLFIHWGPYSLIEGEWNGQKVQVGRNAEWAMKFLKIPVKEYREIAKGMNPVKFDAREWVRLAKETGMKYLVITAKHHDGFAMYKSDVMPYNIVDWTPFKRDPLKELAEACAEEGIVFGVYYSHREDWDHPGGYGNDWEYNNDWGANYYNPEKFDKYLNEFAKPQLRELLTNYGPVGMVWFDRGLYTKEQGEDFMRFVKQYQPKALVNSRVGHYNMENVGDFQEMPDKGIPAAAIDDYFQTPQTLNHTWGYSKADTAWKSPETVIQQLIEVVSRGGSFLLNMGPKGNGEIPEETVKIFKEVGKWVNRNAEGIYGTTTNPFGELGWGYCTVKEDKLYLFVRDWPQNNEISITGLQNQVKSARMLTNDSAKLSVEKSGNQTHITLPQNPTDKPISVLVLELDGKPVVDPQVVTLNEKGELELNYLKVITSGNAKKRYNRKLGFNISKWTNPNDIATWHVQVDKPGIYRVNVDYAADQDSEGRPYEISLGSTLLQPRVAYTGSMFNLLPEYYNFPVGYFEIKEPGKYILSMKPLSVEESNLMYLRKIVLQPMDNQPVGDWSDNR